MIHISMEMLNNDEETPKQPNDIQYTQQDTERLTLAWDLISNSRSNEWLELSDTKGDGITVYKMLQHASYPSLTEMEVPNCEIYHFSLIMHKHKCDLILNASSHKNKLLEKFDPIDHLMVTVHVPSLANRENTIGSVKLFSKISLRSGQIVEIQC